MWLAAVLGVLGGGRNCWSIVDPFLVGAQGCSGWVMPAGLKCERGVFIRRHGIGHFIGSWLSAGFRGVRSV